MSSRRSPRELRASPAVSPAHSRRQSGPGKRHRRAVRTCGRERESAGARRAACSSPRSGWVSTPGTGSRSLVAVVLAPARRTRCSARWPLLRRRDGDCGTRCRGKAGETSTRWRSRPLGLPSRSRRNAPRGALLYSRLSREELEGRFLGPMAYPDPKDERDSSMPGKRWSAQASGAGVSGDPCDMAKAGLPESQSPDDATIRLPERRL
jgi:hypothetical protein